MIREYIIKIDEDKKDIMGNCPLVEKPQELTRCKDCKFAFQHWNNLYRCDNYHGKPNGYGEHQGGWYCADGERRTE